MGKIFHSEMKCLTFSGQKNRIFFPCGAFISRADGGCLSNCPNSKKKFPALENSWLRAFLVFYLFFWVANVIYQNYKIFTVRGHLFL